MQERKTVLSSAFGYSLQIRAGLNLHLQQWLSLLLQDGETISIGIATAVTPLLNIPRGLNEYFMR